jgi:hypothetical protein
LAHLRGNSAIAGFYILDDYPGDIADILSQIHGLVTDDNRNEPAPRATMCSFGAMLDTRQQSQQAWTSDHSYYQKAITNFSPGACDFVALYPYAPPGAQENQVDWSMGQLLPYMLNQLSARGWTPSGQPLIGTPQAFGYPAQQRYPPSGADLRTQADAFCQGGARSLVAYAWNDSYEGAKLELSNDADMRTGFAQAVGDCQRAWAA